MWFVSENKQIGIGFVAAGLGFYILGIILFFNQAFLLLGNLALLVGVGFFMGPQRAFQFFADKERVLFNVAFFTGFFLMIFRWTVLGFLAQMGSLYFMFQSSSYMFIGIFAYQGTIQTNTKVWLDMARRYIGI